MVINVDTETGKKKYTKNIKGKENILKLQEKALALNEAKQNATSAKEEKISSAKRLALAKKADKTELSKLINKGVFALTFPACKNKKLKLSDVEEINFGGAIVGVLVYYVPNFNFEHPIVILISRGIALYLMMKKTCEGLVNILKDKMRPPQGHGTGQGYGKDEREPEGDYIQDGKDVVDDMVAEEMRKQK